MKLSKEDFVTFKLNQLQEEYPWAKNITEKQIDKIISNFSFYHKAYNDIDDLFKQIDGISKKTMMNVPSQINLLSAHNQEGNLKALKIFLPKYNISFLEKENEIPKYLNISKTLIDIVRNRVHDYIKSPEVEEIKNSWIKKYGVRTNFRDYEHLHKFAFNKCGLNERNYEMLAKLQKMTEEELQYQIILNKTGSGKIANFVNYKLDDIYKVLFTKIKPVPIDYDNFRFTNDITNPDILKSFDDMGEIYQNEVGVENISVNAFAHLINSDKNSIDYYLMRKTWSGLEFTDQNLKDTFLKIINSYETLKENPVFQKTKMSEVFKCKEKSITDRDVIGKIIDLTMGKDIQEQYKEIYIDKIINLEDKSSENIINCIHSFSSENIKKNDKIISNQEIDRDIR